MITEYPIKTTNHLCLSIQPMVQQVSIAAHQTLYLRLHQVVATHADGIFKCSQAGDGLMMGNCTLNRTLSPFKHDGSQVIRSLTLIASGGNSVLHITVGLDIEQANGLNMRKQL